MKRNSKTEICEKLTLVQLNEFCKCFGCIVYTYQKSKFKDKYILDMYSPAEPHFGHLTFLVDDYSCTPVNKGLKSQNEKWLNFLTNINKEDILGLN